MAYIFRFEVVENVVRTSERIQRAFGGMRQWASRAKGSVGALGDRVDQLNDELDGTGRQMRRLTAQGENLGGVFNRIGGSIRGIGTAIAGMIAAQSVGRLVQESVQVLANFQRMEAVLTNTLGDGSAAQALMQQIQQFSASTPFQIDEVTDSVVRLANRGFIPTMDQMRQLGDLAASQGKSIRQLVEALLDAETGEFERLKEFGIRASKEGNRVMLSFRGQQVITDLANVRQALLGLGEVQGVAGSMQAMSSTVGGMMSNLQDQVLVFKKALGEAFLPLLNALLPRVIALMQKLAGWMKENGALVLKMAVAVGAVATAFAAWWGIVTVVQAVGAAIALVTSPIGLVVVAVALAAAVIIRYWDNIKAFFIALGKWMWDHHPFVWMFRLIDTVFPSFKRHLSAIWEWIKGLFIRAWNWINDTFLKPLKKVFGDVFAIDMPEKKVTSTPVVSPLQPAAPSPVTESAAPKASLPDNLGLNLSSPRSSGRNINISIGKLVETLSISTQTIEESPGRIRDMIIQTLMDALNDVNYAR